MKRYCIIVNQGKADSMEKAMEIQKSIRRRGGLADILPSRKEGELTGEGFTDVTHIQDGTEAALVLGGDGTLIQAARELAEYEIPVIGINLGTVGFLTEGRMEELEHILDQLWSEQYRIEERLMLTGVVRKQGKVVYESNAMNDIVITRSGYSRIISLGVTVNDSHLVDYRGDGVILSTPTGSTSYNLSAGGPVLLPETKAYVITPICAYSWSLRSVVAHQRDCVRVKIMESKKSQKEEAIVSFDGNNGILLETGDEVEVRQADCQTRLLRLERTETFKNLREKMRCD